jgi:1-acyl-sn-glycerol-3-phosphate acyltransferase
MKAFLFIPVFFACVILGDLQVRFLRIVRSGAAFRAALHRRHIRLARIVLRLARTMTGLRLVVESTLEGPLPCPAIIVANHQSMMDIAFLVYAFPGHDIRFVAKEELGHGVPLIAPSLRYARHALISRRGRFDRTRPALLRLARLPGISPVVFPEGTRSRNGSLGSFHSSAVRVLVEACRLPVLAVAVDGGHLLRGVFQLHRIGEVVYRACLLRVYPPPAGREGTARLLQRIRADIEAQHARWRA